MKKIAFIDPFMVSPAVHSFNDFVKLLNTVTSYHMPSRFGVKSLENCRNETDAYIIVGSASHVTEPLDWHAPLAQLLVEELKSGKPVMGCCFGHQLICHALGSVVDYDLPSQEKHTGLRKVRLTQDHFGFKKGETFQLAVSHKQVVKNLGTGLKEVGIGLPNDIVIHERWPLLLTQAHPEASSIILSEDVEGVADHDGKQMIKRFFEHVL